MAEADFEWHPARLLQNREGSPDFVLLILNQPLRNGGSLRRLWRNCTFVSGEIMGGFVAHPDHSFIKNRG